MTQDTAMPTTPRRWLLAATAALLLWSLCFVVLYGGLSLGCEAGWQSREVLGTNALTLALVLAWAIHLSALVALLAWFVRQPLAPQVRALAVTLTGIAIVATLWIGWPLLALPPCAGPALVTATVPSPTLEASHVR